MPANTKTEKPFNRREHIMRFYTDADYRKACEEGQVQAKLVLPSSLEKSFRFRLEKSDGWEERTYTIRARGDALKVLEKFMAVARTLGAWGASRELRAYIDGDGPDALEVTGLKIRPERESMNAAIDKDSIDLGRLKFDPIEKAAAWPNYGLARVTGQVPRLSLPSELTKMPAPDSLKRRMAFDEPVLRPEGITRGLGLDDGEERAIQREVVENLDMPLLNFIQRLLQKLQYLKLDYGQRSAIAQRAKTYYARCGDDHNERERLERRFQGLRLNKGETVPDRFTIQPARALGQQIASIRQSIAHACDLQKSFVPDWQDSRRQWVSVGGDIEASYDGQRYVDFRNKATGERMMFASAGTIENASQLFVPFEKANPRGGKYHARVAKKGGGYRYFYDEEKYSKREDAHLSGRGVLKRACKAEVCKRVGKGKHLDAVVHEMRGGKYDDDLIKDAIRAAVKGGQLVHEQGMLKPKAAK